MNRSVPIAVVLLVMVAAAGACVAVDGGAVEFEWTVRTADALPNTSCQTEEIGTVSLCVRDCATDDTSACTGPETCPYASFPCDRLHGATAFTIPPGRKALRITASCLDGRPAGVRVPEPVVRDISNGNVTELNALLIAVPAIGGSGCL
jgi:hypothetical protein